MPTLQSHTITHGFFVLCGVREPQAVCQAPQANAQTKAWQRVCLSPRTDEKKSTGTQHCISVMRGELLKLSIFAPKKLCAERTVNCSKIPHYAYT